MPASYRPRIRRVTARPASPPPAWRARELSQGDTRQLYQAKLDMLRAGER